MDALIAFARAGARGPKEIHLPTRDFLWLACDLNIDDDRQRARVMYDPTPPEFVGTEPSAGKVRLRTVRVGESFMFAGPTGMVLIREAKE